MPGVGTYGENGGKTLTNFRMYGSIRLGLPKGILPRFAECSRMSKTGCYESPYAVTGGKAERLDTGLEEAPKGINRIGLLERGKPRTQMLKRLQADVALMGKSENQ